MLAELPTSVWSSLLSTKTKVAYSRCLLIKRASFEPRTLGSFSILKYDLEVSKSQESHIYLFENRRKPPLRVLILCSPVLGFIFVSIFTLIVSLIVLLFNPLSPATFRIHELLFVSISIRRKSLIDDAIIAALLEGAQT